MCIRDSCQMGADCIFELYPTEEKFIGFEVAVCIGFPCSFTIVLLRKKTGGPQDDARESVVSIKELAKILCRRLGHSIDILRHGPDLLGYPGSRRSRRWNNITKNVVKPPAVCR